MWWAALALAAPELSPLAAEAGSTTQLTWSLALEQPLTEGDAVRVQAPRFSGITWAKWTVEVENAADCDATSSETRARRGLVTVDSDGDASLSLSIDEDTDIHKERTYVVRVEAGTLEVGDTVTLTLGGEGDCAWGLPERAYPELRLSAALEVDGREEALDDAVMVLVAGEVAQAMALFPTFVERGESVTGRLVLLDAHGNPVTDQPAYSLSGFSQTLEGTGSIVSWTPQETDLGTFSGTVSGLEVTSNPIWVQESLEQRLYWGDLHTHHGLVYEDADGVLRDDNHDYGRDTIGLDFGSHSIKMASTELDGEDVFEEQRWACEAYTGEDYVAFLGLEWVGHGEVRHGHHNVYFDDCEGAWAAHTDFDGLDSSGGLWPWLEGLEASQGTRALTIPHATQYTGYDFDARDDTLRPLAEVFSTWGDSSTAGDGSVRDALVAGQRWGLIGSSDDHEGYLGNPLSYKNAQGGLAAVWAPERTREALFDAMQARATYATTGARILIDAYAYDRGGDQPMGSAWVPSDDYGVVLVVHGTDTLENVTLVVAPRGGEVSTIEMCEGDSVCERDVALPYVGEEPAAVWIEVDQVDGHRAWSSPFFLHPDCSEAGVADPNGLCPEDSASQETAASTDSDTGEVRGGCDCRTGGVGGLGLWLVPMWLVRRARSPVKCR